MNILRGLGDQKQNFLDTSNNRECLGRELCLRSLRSNSEDKHLTPVQTVLYMMESFALAYLQLDDHSRSFSDFIEAMTVNGGPSDPSDCFRLFSYCGVEELYQYKSLSN
jgi:hypothetical protein